MINLGEAKKVTFKTLLENNIKDYQFEGLSLLSKILELDTKTVITENNIEISIEQKYLIEKITKKRIEGMPLAYLTKEKLFFQEGPLFLDSYWNPGHLLNKSMFSDADFCCK